jgi:competence protein ComGF
MSNNGIKLVSTGTLKKYIQAVHSATKDELLDLEWRKSLGEFELMKSEYHKLMNNKRGQLTALKEIVRILKRIENETIKPL